MADIEIEIDGQKLTADPSQTVMQVADAAGIYIPRFCYHKHLSIAANCRMCLVEIEKSPKTQPACATPVMPGMKVFTKSQKTLDAQRAVMEFLLINHPLDCPICDQGGECELQDLSMGYGGSTSKYDECKRAVPDQDIGPLIATEMTRCIQCTRCVRFGDEVAGMQELGVINRGQENAISTYVQQAIRSEVSGNIIDLCPVGALTSKPYRFQARAWELDQAPSISPHDCIGSNLNVHTRYGKVLRVVSRENPTLNETWIADRDRYSYEGLYHADRLAKPKVKLHGEWKEVEWHQAFEIATKGLQDVIAKSGADAVGALASPSSTLEEFYLLQKIMRGLGSSHVDHRLREIDTRDQDAMSAHPGLSMSLNELEQSDAILLIGSNLQKELPLAALRVRKATKKNAAVFVVNSMDYRFNFPVTGKAIVAPSALSTVLDDIAQGHHEIAKQLQAKKNISILLGTQALHQSDAALLRYLAQQIAEKFGAKIGFITDGANAAGAWLAGAIPHREAAGRKAKKAGLNAYEMLANPREAYLLINVEPDLDCANSAMAVEAIKQAKFVVALSIYRNAILEDQADVILPMTPFTETSGTYVNAFGQWQSFKGVAKSFESSRPAWKLLRVLGNFLHLEGFGYESSEEIKHEVHELVEKMPKMSLHLTAIKSTSSMNKISRIGEIPIYAIDSLVRRSEPLQDAQGIMEGETSAVRLNSEMIKKMNLHNGDPVSVKQDSMSVKLPVLADERVPNDAAWIAGGMVATVGLGDLFGDVEIVKC